MALSTGRRSLTTFISRALSHKPSSFSRTRFSHKPSPLSSFSRTRFSLANPHDSLPPPLFSNSAIRFMCTDGGYSPIDDPSPNWSNRPPRETISLDGCDYEHWLVILEFPDPKPSNEEMINAYVKILAQIVGSEEEAKKNIYSVSTSTYTGFGCSISEELSYKLKEIREVLWVLPDSYLDVPNKDYGGDLFVDGKVIRRPQYDFSDRESTKSRNRPRHDRRRESRPVERRGPPQEDSQDPNQTEQQNTQQATPMETGNASQAEAAGVSTGV